jgi:NodT family efflux transporter outer membrane factor (OMF) lipoprotein
MRANRSSLPRSPLVAALALILSACAVGPDYVRPEPPQAERITREPLPAATIVADGHAQTFTPGVAVPADWWRLFRSVPLDAIVRQALIGNPTVQASIESLKQSRDNLAAGYGLFMPQVGSEADATRQRNAPLAEGFSIPGSIYNVVSLSGTVSYALDIFGGERRTVEVLQAQRDSQDFTVKAAYLALTANVVDTVIARAAYAGEARATRQLIDLQTIQLRATEAQVRAGTASYASVLSIASQIAANKALLAPLELKINQAEHLLATLEGALPATATLPEVELGAITLPIDLPVSLPADLVRQRPDILAAEAQVHAASANIGVATALMFPSISLSGTYGVAGASLGNVSASSGTFWSIGPSVSVPIFQGGRLWYGRRAAIDAFHQAQDNYRQVVLSAFEQVADALKALQHDAEALQAQADAERFARDSLTLLQVNYQAGLTAYIDVVTGDVQLHQATISYLQTVAQRHQDTVALFAALGGGWWNAEHQPGGTEAP